MVIVSDKFHCTTGHKTCPSSTKVPFWEERDVITADWRPADEENLNTSAAEQLNNRLRVIDKSMRFQSTSNCILMGNALAVYNNLQVKDIIT